MPLWSLDRRSVFSPLDNDPDAAEIREVVREAITGTVDEHEPS